MSIKTITVLPASEWRVIKQLSITSDFSYGGNNRVGYLLYERSLTNQYRFREIPGEDSAARLYGVYPTQEHYPTDELDDLILQAVRNTFENVVVRNYLLLTNVNQQQVIQLQSKKAEECELSFSPNFSQANIYELASSYKGVVKSAKLYNDVPREIDKDVVFIGHFPLNNDQILNRVEAVKFI